MNCGRRYWLILWCFVLASSVPAYAEPLLWKVTAPSSDTEIYLFGSIHFGHEALYPLPVKVMQAYGRSDIVAVELDAEAAAPQDMAQLIEASVRLPAGGKLQNELNESIWEELESVCAQMAFDPDYFSTLKPWFAAVQLVTLQIQQAGFNPEKGIDRYFLKHARKHKKIIELESLEEQLGIFDQLTSKEQSAFLQQSLTDFQKGTVYLENIAGAWQRGDEQELHELVLSPFEADAVPEKMFKLFFNDRNKRMAQAVEGFLLQGKKVFVVVGVGHLIGENSVVKILKLNGYRVQKL